LADSITSSASGARVGQKNARTFPQNKWKMAFCCMYRGRLKRLTYYFYRKQHGSFKIFQVLKQENALKEIQETVVNQRTASILNPAKQATLKCTENELKQRMFEE